MVAPQVFQGMSGEVTVPASSSTRERFRGARPRFRYSSLNILPGMAMAIQWSPRRTLQNRAEIIVTSTSEPVLLANSSSLLAITLIMPVHSRIPPKDRAQMIRETVHIMLMRPPLVRSSSTMAWPVSTTTPFCTALNTMDKS